MISGAPWDVLDAYFPEWPIDIIFALEVQRIGASWSLKNRGLYREKQEIVKNLCDDFLIVFGFGNSLSDIPILDAARVPILMNSPVEGFPCSIRRRLIPCTANNVEGVVIEQLRRLATPVSDEATK